MPPSSKEIGTTVLCPYCKRRGKLADVWPNGDVLVVHEIETRDEPCAGQGTMKVQHLVDYCSTTVQKRKPNP